MFSICVWPELQALNSEADFKNKMLTHPWTGLLRTFHATHSRCLHTVAMTSWAGWELPVSSTTASRTGFYLLTCCCLNETSESDYSSPYPALPLILMF